MALHAVEIFNCTEQYKKTVQPVTINHIPTHPDEQKNIYNLIFRSIGADASLWSCDCGYLTGARHRGVRCPKPECNTPVRSITDSADALKIRTWLEAPPVLKYGWLHPAFSRLLGSWVGTKADNPLRSILDPSVPLHPSLDGVVTGRGMTYFYENFERIIDHWLHNDPHTRKKDIAAYMPHMLAKYPKDTCIFTRYLPVLPRAMYPIVQEHNKKIVDTSAAYIMGVIASLSWLQDKTVDWDSTSPMAMRRKFKIESAIYNTQYQYEQYVDSSYSSMMQGKGSVMRAHLYGTRLHFTSRAVIVPDCTNEGSTWSWEIMDRSDVAPWNRVILPRITLLVMLEYHITNILVKKYGMHYYAARTYVRSHHYKDCPILDEILTWLLKNHPCGGWPIGLDRNPTIKLGGFQTLICDRFHPLGVNVISVSLEHLRDCNGDFDGDALNVTAFMETAAARAFESMLPIRRMIDLDNPYALTGTMAVLPDGAPPVLSAFLADSL